MAKTFHDLTTASNNHSKSPEFNPIKPIVGAAKAVEHAVVAVVKKGTAPTPDVKYPGQYGYDEWVREQRNKSLPRTGRGKPLP